VNILLELLQIVSFNSTQNLTSPNVTELCAHQSTLATEVELANQALDSAFLHHHLRMQALAMMEMPALITTPALTEPVLELQSFALPQINAMLKEFATAKLEIAPILLPAIILPAVMVICALKSILAKEVSVKEPLVNLVLPQYHATKMESAILPLVSARIHYQPT
jgi:hypothetical protein